MKKVLLGLFCPALLATCVAPTGEVTTFTDQNGTGQPELDREPVLASSMNSIEILHRTPKALYHITLIPTQKALTIIYYGKGSGGWRDDLSQQKEGEFQPLCMIETIPGKIVVAGRMVGTFDSAIYEFSFDWSKLRPNLVSRRIYLGTDIGDITGMVQIDELKETIAVFDYSNAAIASVDLESGMVKRLLSPDSEHLELLEAKGMRADWIAPNEEKGTPAGVWYTLQPTQGINLLRGGILTINAVDYGIDGTIDKYFVE